MGGLAFWLTLTWAALGFTAGRAGAGLPRVTDLCGGTVSFFVCAVLDPVVIPAAGKAYQECLVLDSYELLCL